MCVVYAREGGKNRGWPRWKGGRRRHSSFPRQGEERRSRPWLANASLVNEPWAHATLARAQHGLRAVYTRPPPVSRLSLLRTMRPTDGSIESIRGLNKRVMRPSSSSFSSSFSLSRGIGQEQCLSAWTRIDAWREREGRRKWERRWSLAMIRTCEWGTRWSQVFSSSRRRWFDIFKECRMWIFKDIDCGDMQIRWLVDVDSWCEFETERCTGVNEWIIIERKRGGRLCRDYWVFSFRALFFIGEKCYLFFLAKRTNCILRF